MRRFPTLALLSLGLLAIGLAFTARELVYDLIIVPMAYVFWQLSILMGAVPELIRWAVITVLLILVIAWQVIPDVRSRSIGTDRTAPPVREVESAAIWLHRARKSNYFRWQIAHRLGRVAHELEALEGRKPGGPRTSQEVSGYLSAGTEGSFVDFPARRGWLKPRQPTALDVNPAAVVDYLETQAFVDWKKNAHRS